MKLTPGVQLPRALQRETGKEAAHLREETKRCFERWKERPLRGAASTITALVFLLLSSNIVEAKKPPEESTTTKASPNVLSAAAIVLDLETGEELFAKAADKQRSIASLSKLAAALAVRKAGIDVTKVTEITAEDAKIARRGATPHLGVGWKLTNQDLLFAALIASENRAVPALGRGAGLSVNELISAMNEVAADLGLASTTFDETTGLSYQNKSTAREVAALLKAALADEILAEAMRAGSWKISLQKPAGQSIVIKNTNKLTRSKQYTVLGGKTGFNNKAGLCLATALDLGFRKVIIVVLGARSGSARYTDIQNIVRWLEARDAARVVTP